MSDTLARDIGFYLYENQAKLWPHLAEPGISKAPGYDEHKSAQASAVLNENGKRLIIPEGYAAASNGEMPTTPAGRHAALLSPKEVVGAYEAVAFAMSEYGIILNTHITIHWGSLGVDPISACQLLTAWNSEAAKWMRVGSARPRKRYTRRYGHSSKHVYVHIHECGGFNGFHTHQLCYLEPAVAKDFVAWSKACFARLTKKSSIPNDAIYVVTRPAKIERVAIDKCWAWFRYMIKQLDTSFAVPEDNGKTRPLSSIFKPWPQRQMLPLPVATAVRASHNLGRGARRNAGFQSRLDLREWSLIYSGLELEDYRSRILLEDSKRDDEQSITLLNV